MNKIFVRNTNWLCTFFNIFMKFAQKCSRQIDWINGFFFHDFRRIVCIISFSFIQQFETTDPSLSSPCVCVWQANAHARESISIIKYFNNDGQTSPFFVHMIDSYSGNFTSFLSACAAVSLSLSRSLSLFHSHDRSCYLWHWSKNQVSGTKHTGIWMWVVNISLLKAKA